MKFVDSYFNTPKIRRFIKDLIKDYDRKDYSDLTYADKCSFSSILIDTANKSGEAECIIESNDLDQIVYFLKKALCGHHVDEQNLIHSLKNAAIEYYEKIMEALFEDVFNEYENEKEEWVNYISRHGDPDELYDRQWSDRR